MVVDRPKKRLDHGQIGAPRPRGVEVFDERVEVAVVVAVGVGPIVALSHRRRVEAVIPCGGSMKASTAASDKRSRSDSGVAQWLSRASAIGTMSCCPGLRMPTEEEEVQAEPDELRRRWAVSVGAEVCQPTAEAPDQLDGPTVRDQQLRDHGALSRSHPPVVLVSRQRAALRSAGGTNLRASGARRTRGRGCAGRLLRRWSIRHPRSITDRSRRERLLAELPEDECKRILEQAPVPKPMPYGGRALAMGSGHKHGVELVHGATPTGRGCLASYRRAARASCAARTPPQACRGAPGEFGGAGSERTPGSNRGS